MSLVQQNFTQKSKQLSDKKQNNNQDKSNIYTLENLIQTLEEAANYSRGQGG